MSQKNLFAVAPAATFDDIRDRRRAPRRRLADRMASLDRTINPTLSASPVADVVMLAEDDLRQAALSLGALERFLGASLALLEKRGVTAGELRSHADDEAVLDRVESLAGNLDDLRRRMASIASLLR